VVLESWIHRCVEIALVFRPESRSTECSKRQKDRIWEQSEHESENESDIIRIV